MKTKYKYLEFEKQDGSWICFNHVTHEQLGFVVYGKRWRQWESVLMNDIGFTQQCHIDMAHFLGQLNEETKAKSVKLPAARSKK